MDHGNPEIWPMWLGSLLMGRPCRGGLCRPRFSARAFEAVEHDLAEKLRRLRHRRRTCVNI